MSMGEVLPKLMAHYPLACTYYLKLRTATIKALQGKSYSTLYMYSFTNISALAIHTDLVKKY